MKDERIIASIDDGHHNGKGQLISKGGDVTSFISPTLIMHGSYSSFGSASQNPDVSEFKTVNADGQDEYYTVFQRLRYGEAEHMIDTQNQDYLLSEANRVFVHSMLHRMGLSGQKVELVTTLPIRRYFKKSGNLDQDYIDARNENLKKSVIPMNGDEPVEIVSVTQMPESFVSYLSLLIKYQNNKGQGRISVDSEYLNKDILILDFGGQTLDVGVVSRGQLQTKKCETFEGVGMLAVNELLADELRSYRKNLDRLELDNIISTGKFRPSKQSDAEHDVSHIVQSCINAVYTNGIEKIKARFPMHDFHLILGAGGPLVCISNLVKQLIPEIQIVEDPLMSNSNGGLKYLLKKKAKASDSESA
ncbi:ParM/StbA family protein [Vibrio cholerae]|nr:ParM/StbA family protein [Vibrio cholerae]